MRLRGIPADQWRKLPDFALFDDLWRKKLSACRLRSHDPWGVCFLVLRRLLAAGRAPRTHSSSHRLPVLFDVFCVRPPLYQAIGLPSSLAEPVNTSFRMLAALSDLLYSYPPRTGSKINARIRVRRPDSSLTSQTGMVYAPDVPDCSPTGG